MRNDLTDITLVVDRSGSMAVIAEEASAGINTFIKEQAKQPGEALLTLVQFDTEYDFIHKGVSVKDVPEYKLQARWGTALLDAVGRAITETGARLAAMDEKDRPGLVVFVIATDGMENSSREFTLERIKQMTKEQQEKYNWQFTYLGANQDAFAVGGSMGFTQVSSAGYNINKVGQAYSNTSNKVSRMRSAVCSALPIDNSYTEEEKTSMQ